MDKRNWSTNRNKGNKQLIINLYSFILQFIQKYVMNAYSFAIISALCIGIILGMITLQFIDRGLPVSEIERDVVAKSDNLITESATSELHVTFPAFFVVQAGLFHHMENAVNMKSKVE